MNVYNGRIGQIAQEIFRSRIEARHVNAGHYMPFKHHISFATDLAANFGCNRFRIMPDIISTLLSPPSEVDVLFESNLSRRPFHWVVYLDLLLCTGFNLEHVVLFLCHIFHGISPPATNFFAYRTVILGLFKLNIKARHEVREFLNANL